MLQKSTYYFSGDNNSNIFNKYFHFHSLFQSYHLFFRPCSNERKADNDGCRNYQIDDFTIPIWDEIEG